MPVVVFKNAQVGEICVTLASSCSRAPREVIFTDAKCITYRGLIVPKTMSFSYVQIGSCIEGQFGLL